MGNIWPIEYRSIKCIWLPDWLKNLLLNNLLFLVSMFGGHHRRNDLKSWNECIAQSSPESLLTTVNIHMRKKYTSHATLLQYVIWGCFPAFVYSKTLFFHSHFQHICWFVAKCLLGQKGCCMSVRIGAVNMPQQREHVQDFLSCRLGNAQETSRRKYQGNNQDLLNH